MLPLFSNSLKNIALLSALLSIAACGSSSSKKNDTTAPEFTSGNSFSINENTTFVTTVNASDDSTISYSISDGADSTKLQINSSSGALSFINSPDFDNPSDTDANNSYIIEVTATDSSANKTKQIITILITKPDRSKPVFTSANTTSIIEDHVDVLTVQATDNSQISYAITGGNDASRFEINATTGILKFKVAPDYESPTDHDSNNTYSVEVTAKDSSDNREAQLITVTIIDDEVNFTGDYSVTSLGVGFSSTAIVNLGNTPKTLYALFTNNSATTSSAPTVNHQPFEQNIVSNPRLKITEEKLDQSAQTTHAPPRMTLFSKNNRDLIVSNNKLSPKLKTITRREKVASGDTNTFTTDIDFIGGITQTTEATARKVVSNIETSFGPKTLNIWVSNDSYGEGCSKIIEGNPYCVTADLVDELAEKFLSNGLSNDIYDWVTNIYGEEWAETGLDYYIPDNDEINILLTDINLVPGDLNNPTGGVVGYYTSKDNYLKSSIPGSNERIMFYIDSVVYANNSAAFKFQKLIYATLAHEFTHMLEFYQKDILKDKSSDTWLAEMTAEATEYLTSNHVQHDSPRGIRFNVGGDGTSLLTAPDKLTTDRFPDFNKYNNTFSLTSFDNTVEEYSKVSSFGAFLMNNYGGPELLHDIVHSSEIDENAVVEAANKFKGTTNITFGDLLKEWGVAVLLSDIVNPQLGIPRFNTGDFTTTSYKGTDYDIGSINFFNYVTGSDAQNVFEFGPTISTTVGNVPAHGNYYYKVGDNLTGTINIELEADSNTEITLIAK